MSQPLDIRGGHDISSLQQLLYGIRVQNCDTKFFIPEDKLRAVLSKDAVIEVLKRHHPFYLADEIVRFILDRALKVFGVLILMGEIIQIRRFVQNDQFRTNQMDDQIPFAKETLRSILVLPHLADQFFEKQWEFIAPTFSGQVVPRTLEPWTVFPYVSETPLGSGGYGSIFKIKVHPSYQPRGLGPAVEFVRKELGYHDQTFKNEARILSILQRLKHPNILLLVGCYTWRSKHNLISPYISGGTLRDFLQRDKSTEISRKDIFCALSGLASAVWALHEFIAEDIDARLKGHHQDLKPENILVDGMRFILADFGLSSMKELSSKSDTPFKGRTGYCQAPECSDLDPPYHEHETTRPADIFALGCVTLDVLVYLLDGAGGVSRFEKARKFERPPFSYSLFHNGSSPNKAVVDQLEKVSTEDASSSMIEVVQLTRHMLEISPSHRPTAAQVTCRLYLCTFKAYSEDIFKLFDRLPRTPEVFVERARFSGWLIYQDVDHFLSMSCATSTLSVFESATQLLRQMLDELVAISNRSNIPDHRSLLEIRTMNTQLLNKLSPDRRSKARDHVASVVLAKMPSLVATERVAGDSPLGNHRLVQMAEVKQLVNQIEGDVDPPSSANTIRMCLKSEYSEKVINNLKIAEFTRSDDSESKLLLLESIQYEDMVSYKKLWPRVQALCHALSTKSSDFQLRTPPFFALCDNRDEFSWEILLECPRKAMHAQELPITLQTLLRKPKMSYSPPLDHRVGLAFHLAESLAAFHDVGWFHKNLVPSNIIFSPAKDQDHLVNLCDPYICGFRYSRDTAGFTDGPLQDRPYHQHHHPDYISKGSGSFKTFIQPYDWYSLGILLIEIGLWRTIDTVVSPYHTKTRHDFTAQLIRDHLPHLSFFVGTVYVEVVRFFLAYTGTVFRESTDINTEELNITFRARVVFPLKAMVSK